MNCSPFGNSDDPDLKVSRSGGASERDDLACLAKVRGWQIFRPQSVPIVTSCTEFPEDTLSYL